MTKAFYYVHPPIPAVTHAAWICGKCGIGNKAEKNSCTSCSTNRTYSKNKVEEPEEVLA